MKKLFANALILTLCASLLTACGGSQVTSNSSSYAVAETAAAAAYDVGGMKSEPVEEMAFEDFSEESGATSALGGNAGAAPADSTQPQIARKLIRTLRLNVETDDFDTLMTKLDEQIRALEGYVEQSDVSGRSMEYEHSRRNAYMIVRIPSTKLDEFATSVESIGNVTNRSESTEDITLRYSDIESKKKTLEIEQERIWDLLEKAESIETIIALEERLSEIRYELESMGSTLRLYDNQVDYSTVHIDIREVKVFTPTAPETIGERIRKGFQENTEQMTKFLTDLAVSVIAGIPIWLPLLILAVPIVLFVRSRNAKKKLRRAAASVPNGFTVSQTAEKLTASDTEHDTTAP